MTALLNETKPNSIPEDWDMRTIDDFTFIASGGTPQYH